MAYTLQSRDMKNSSTLYTVYANKKAIANKKVTLYTICTYCTYLANIQLIASTPQPRHGQFNC